MANSELLPLVQSVLPTLEALYPPVKLMVNFDNLHDAYIIRASVGPIVSQQYVYHHEITQGSALVSALRLFHGRALDAIKRLIPDQNEMQGASEYDEIMQAQTIMHELKP